MRLHCESGRGKGEVRPHGIILWAPLASGSRLTRYSSGSLPPSPGKMKQSSTKENEGWVLMVKIYDLKHASYQVDQALPTFAQCNIMQVCRKHRFSTAGDDVMLWHFQGTTSSSEATYAVLAIVAWATNEATQRQKTTTRNLGRSHAVTKDNARKLKVGEWCPCAETQDTGNNSCTVTRGLHQGWHPWRNTEVTGKASEKCKALKKSSGKNIHSNTI